MASFTFLFLSVLLYLMTPTAIVAVGATNITPSKHGLCGAIFKQTCIGYKYGESCSEFDICGPQENPFFSGKGCQHKYGLCGPVKSTSTKKPTSTSNTKKPTTTSPTKTAPTTSPTRTASSITTTSTTSSAPPSGSPISTSAYKGGIAALPAGTPVAIRNPSFESSQAGTSKKRSRLSARQSSGQIAASTTGWTIAACNGPAGSCFFENYDAADGIWAFSATNGGAIYQSDVILTIGASYIFTWYWKTVVPSGKTTIQGVFLGNDGNADTGNTYTVGTPAFGQVANGDWAEVEIALGQLTCGIVKEYGVDNGDGTATFRMFVAGQACPQGTPCYDPSDPSPAFTYFVDEVRVQATATPAAVMMC